MTATMKTVPATEDVTSRGVADDLGAEAGES
jgi:hypothetical protein